ncbi:MAG: AAA family ATPase [Gemmatimonadales bacterium]|nr:AAA family ATPase [Gemmatimonadales bacterium]
MSAPGLVLQLLGAPAAWVGGAPAPPEVLWRKHLALLAHLALVPGRRATRAQLHGLLWPEVDDERARRSLNEAVRRLRLHLGRERLRTVGEILELASDGLALDAAGPEAWPTPATPLPVLLEGFALEGAEAFDHWLEGERRRVRARLLDLARERGTAALVAGRLAEASAWGERIVASEPLSPAGVALLMRARVLAGDRSGALAAHRAHVAALAELGETPLPEVTALAARVREGGGEATSGAQAVAPLVGREALHARLFGLLDDLPRAGARLAAVSGAAGHGKSRLLEALAERARLAGYSVLGGTLPGAADPAPWGLLRAVLRAGLGTLPGARGAAPDALATLAGLAPGSITSGAASELTDDGAVAAALAALLGAVADERPLVLVVDDADAADARSLGALHEALRALRSSPLLVAVGTAPPAPDMPAPLLALLGDLGRRVGGVHLGLEPFDAAEVRALVAVSAGWCTDDTERDRLARRLCYETEGDPLLCATLLDSLHELTHARDDMLAWPPPNLTLESPLPVPVPVVLHSLLTARIARVPPADRLVLGAAAVAGADVDEATVAGMAGLALAEVEAALVRLERARLLDFDGRRFRFAAPLLATLARHICLTSAERRQVARRGLEAMPPDVDAAATLRRCELQLAARDAVGAARSALSLLQAGAGAELPRNARLAVERAADALRSTDESDAVRTELLAAIARHRAARAASAV